MITLAFLLDHQVISRSDKNTVVAGSKNYVRARFVLRTDDWARPITAIFGGYTAEDVAGIEVRYLADGEKYIDRKISEAITSAAETKLAAYDALSGAIHDGVNEA